MKNVLTSSHNEIIIKKSSHNANVKEGSEIMTLDREKVMLKMTKLEINQTQLAERAGVSRQTMSQIMNGRKCKPDLFGRVSKALNCEPEEILAD